MDILISIDDIAAKAQLQGYQSKLNNLQPAFASIGEYMLRRVDDNFKNERSPDGTLFAPLTAAYLKRKKNRKILTESGRLRGSINYRAEARRVVVGTNVVYARVHQLGYKERKIPARPFLGVTAKDEAAAGDIILDYLEKT